MEISKGGFKSFYGLALKNRYALEEAWAGYRVKFLIWRLYMEGKCPKGILNVQKDISRI